MRRAAAVLAVGFAAAVTMTGFAYGGGPAEATVTEVSFEAVQPGADTFGGTYNLCWTNSVPFLDGEIEVRLRADTGHEDEGGGPIWRVRDRNNCYISRYNSLEHNCRLYLVKDGARKMLDSAARIEIPRGAWFTIKIVQQGDHIEGWLDGKKLLDARDTTFTGQGGVGLWTKADAATAFDDFTVRPNGE